jgi:hypothetical protein
MKTKVLFFVLALAFVTKADSQIVVRREMEVSTLKIHQIEEFANNFAKEVGDSLAINYPVSIEYLRLTISGAVDSCFYLHYEARLYESDQEYADFKIRRVGSVGVSSSLKRSAKIAFRRMKKKSDDLKPSIVKTYGGERVRVIPTSDHQTLKTKKGRTVTVCIMEKFFVIRRLKPSHQN